MSHEFNPENGEVIASAQLRDATPSLVPAFAIENQRGVRVRYPLTRPYKHISFVEIDYMPGEVCLDIVETETLESDTAEESDWPTFIRSSYTSEYHGMIKRCTFDPMTAEINLYYEETGKLDPRRENFIQDERQASPAQTPPEPSTPEERLSRAIFGTPRPQEEVDLESIYWGLQTFTEDKLNILLGHFVELGAIQM